MNSNICKQWEGVGLHNAKQILFEGKHIYLSIYVSLGFSDSE